MAEVKKYPDVDPPPDPPAIMVSTYVFLGAAGVLHLIFAALSEMPEVLHQVLAVLEILIAAGIAITALNWRKEYDAWVARNPGGHAPSSTGNG